MNKERGGDLVLLWSGQHKTLGLLSLTVLQWGFIDWERETACVTVRVIHQSMSSKGSWWRLTVMELMIYCGIFSKMICFLFILWRIWYCLYVHSVSYWLSLSLLLCSYTFHVTFIPNHMWYLNSCTSSSILNFFYFPLSSTLGLYQIIYQNSFPIQL